MCVHVYSAPHRQACRQRYADGGRYAAAVLQHYEEWKDTRQDQALTQIMQTESDSDYEFCECVDEEFDGWDDADLLTPAQMV